MSAPSALQRMRGFARDQLGVAQRDMDAYVKTAMQAATRELAILHDSLQHPVQGADPAPVREAAHSLKGTLGAMGLAGASALAGGLEHAAAQAPDVASIHGAQQVADQLAGALAPLLHEWREQEEMQR